MIIMTIITIRKSTSPVISNCCLSVRVLYQSLQAASPALECMESKLQTFELQIICARYWIILIQLICVGSIESNRSENKTIN